MDLKQFFAGIEVLNAERAASIAGEVQGRAWARRLATPPAPPRTDVASVTVLDLRFGRK